LITAANRASLKLDWDSYTPPTPAFTGTKVLEDYPLEKLIDYIDWTPFFITWSLAGKYHSILSDEKVGAAARDLFKDAQEMLTEIVQHKLITARAVFGFWEGNSVGNDVIWVPPQTIKIFIFCVSKCLSRTNNLTFV